MNSKIFKKIYGVFHHINLIFTNKTSIISFSLIRFQLNIHYLLKFFYCLVFFILVYKFLNCKIAIKIIIYIKINTYLLFYKGLRESDQK